MASSIPLLDDEEILVDARPAWSAFLRLFVLAGLLFLGGLLSGGSSGVLTGLVLAGLVVGYIVYRRYRVRYVVTDRRMVTVRGVSSTATNEVWMVDVVNLKSGSSFLEGLLGHGHIVVSRDIQSFGGLLGGMRFGGIENHEEVAQIIRERQNADKL
jgi:uncharacterized membrane protein